MPRTDPCGLPRLGALANDGTLCLTSQIRRAAASAATNIAEGAVRRGSREFAKFLRYAVSSLGEVSYQLRLARDLGYLNGEDPNQEVVEFCNDAIRVTWKLCQQMERAARRPASDSA